METAKQLWEKPSLKTRIVRYPNGNGVVDIYSDGTRFITCEAEPFLPNYPLNIDLRVSTTCSFGFNQANGAVFCSFCHESAVTEGQDANYDLLREKLAPLPAGIELAIGVNQLNEDLVLFCRWAKLNGFIVNLTINQGHVRRDIKWLEYLINLKYVHGLGISYRPSLKWDVPIQLLSYPHTVFHVIVGIDTVGQVKKLAAKGVRKVVILGEKGIGFNKSKFKPYSEKHMRWQWQVQNLFKEFKVLSFDNLALEQLDVKRFLDNDIWTSFYQHEHSIYIDAVKKTYARSSRHTETRSWDNLSVQEFFEQIRNESLQIV